MHPHDIHPFISSTPIPAVRWTHRRSSQLLNKAPFSREEQVRVVCASVSYCPETWAQPGDAPMAARFVRTLEGRQQAPGGDEEEEAGQGSRKKKKETRKRKRPQRLAEVESEEEEEEGGEEEGREKEEQGDGQGHEREYGAGWANVAEHLPTRTDSQCRCVRCGVAAEHCVSISYARTD